MILSIGSSHALAGSLRDDLRGMFGRVLDLQLAGSPGGHGAHFRPANVEASGQLITALGELVGSSTGRFGFSSTGAGVSYDLSTGVPVATRSSLGPILAERAETIGRGQINMGWNFSFLNQSMLRGLDLNDVRFTFTHEDVGLPGLGDSSNELDTIDMRPRLDIDTNVLVFFGAVGVTDRLDVGVVVPFVNVQLRANPEAVINSFTFASNDTANHYFGGTPTDPVLTSTGPRIQDDAVGIGDILVRVKYEFISSASRGMALMVDVRPPTGDEDDFLGIGHATARFTLIASAAVADFTPHANIAFDYRNSDIERDRVDLFAGFDQKLYERLTIAGDVLGRFEVGKRNPATVFPRTAEISRPAGASTYRRTVSLTNIPDFRSDHVVDGALGFRFAPRRSLLIVGNVLVPLNRGGLRSTIVPTLGVEFTL